MHEVLDEYKRVFRRELGYDYLLTLVRNNDKGRFSMWAHDGEATYIRANQGHSLDGLRDDLLFNGLVRLNDLEDDLLYHGTTVANVNNIIRNGIYAGGIPAAERALQLGTPGIGEGRALKKSRLVVRLS